MAVQPNSTSYAFTTWALATSWLEITASQTVLVTQIQTAANDQTTVTDHVWNQFLRVSGLWYQYYISFIAQTTTVAAIPSGIAQGDLLYGSAANTLARLAKSGSASRFLKNSGTSNNPAWVQPAITDLSDFVDWTDYSATSTIVGWSSYTTKKIYYSKIGKTLFVLVDISGTSNSISTNITLPYTSINNGGVIACAQPIVAADNGLGIYGLSNMLTNNTQLRFYTSPIGGNWVASGTKTIRANFTIPLK